MALVTLWALIDDLEDMVSLWPTMRIGRVRAYHDLDLTVGAGHLEAPTALGGIVPGRTGKGGTVQPRWDTRHGGERACSPVEVSTVEGGRAGDSSGTQNISRDAG